MFHHVLISIRFFVNDVYIIDISNLLFIFLYTHKVFLSFPSSWALILLYLVFTLFITDIFDIHILIMIL